jgi:hypothetical protein
MRSTLMDTVTRHFECQKVTVPRGYLSQDTVVQLCSRVRTDDRFRLSTRWTGTDTAAKGPSHHVVTLSTEISLGAAADLAMPSSRSSASRRCTTRRRFSRAKSPLEESCEPPEDLSRPRQQLQQPKPKHWPRRIFRDFDRHPVHWTRRYLVGTRVLRDEANDAIRGLLLCRWLPLQTGGLRYSPHRTTYLYRFLRDHCDTILLPFLSSRQRLAAVRGRSLRKKRRRSG